MAEHFSEESEMRDSPAAAPFEGAAPDRSRVGATILLVGLMFLDFLAHMLFAGNYGYFRDELYYIEAGHHLAAGYVDFPPAIAVLAALLRVLAGDSLVAIHLVPAIASSLVVLLTGLMARQLGGGRFAQVLAASASLVAITFLATGSIFSMDSLDELWWTLGAYVVVLILKQGRPRLWLLFGLVAGVGLATKLTMLFFGFALVVGLLLTPSRRVFRSGWIWLGGAISFAFLMPYALWNLANGWPTLQFWAGYAGESGGPLAFLSGQLLGMNPFTLPLSFAGLYFYLRASSGRPYRALGWTFIVLLVLFTLLGAKPYFLSPAYPILYAGGALTIERRGGRVWRFLKPAYAALLFLSGLMFAPLAMPILPPATLVDSYGLLPGSANASAGQSAAGALPQNLGDRFGWERMTRTVAGVYKTLPTQERSKACIFTSNYGEASALNFLGKKYALPRAISGHNNYYLWGPGSCGGRTMITVGIARKDIEKGYSRVKRTATIRCGYCEPYENDLPVYVATKPKTPLKEVWPLTKHYD